MYLTGWDMVAVVIALTCSLTLIVSTAAANARLTRTLKEARESRNEWRSAYYDMPRNSCEDCD